LFSDIEKQNKIVEEKESLKKLLVLLKFFSLFLQMSYWELEIVGFFDTFGVEYSRVCNF
jgi:hypothetical protein